MSKHISLENFSHKEPKRSDFWKNFGTPILVCIMTGVFTLITAIITNFGQQKTSKELSDIETRLTQKIENDKTVQSYWQKIDDILEKNPKLVTNDNLPNLALAEGQIIKIDALTRIYSKLLDDKDHKKLIILYLYELGLLNHTNSSDNGTGVPGKCKTEPTMYCSLGTNRYNLQGVDFENVFLKHIKLHNSYLNRANLKEAKLIGAELINTGLRKADLTGAKIQQANLSDSTLTGANLTGANLTGATITKANFECANLSGATLNNLKVDQDNPAIYYQTTFPTNYEPSPDIWKEVIPDEVSSGKVKPDEYCGNLTE